MKIISDMQCAPFREGEKFSIMNETGHADIFQFDLGFGVVIKIADVQLEYLETPEQVTDNNILGMLVCMNGSVNPYIDNDVHTMIPCTAVFGRPGSRPSRLEFPAKSCKAIALGFKPSLDIPHLKSDPDPRYMLAVLKTRYEGNAQKPFKVPLDLFQVLETIMMELTYHGTSNDAFLKRRIAEALHIIFHMGEPEYTRIATTKNIEIVDMMCSNMVKDLTNIPNIKKMCVDEGVNEFWFIRNFKKRYGRTPYEYHKLARHIRAATLLLSERYSVGDVAKIVGYGSQSKFSMAFKEIHGCRPKHYPRFFEAKIENGENIEFPDD